MNKIKNSKKQLPSGEREELLKALEARFQKNMNRHKGLEMGQRLKQSWKLIPKNCGHSMRWKEPAVNRMWWVRIRRRANTFFSIVRRKRPVTA